MCRPQRYHFLTVGTRPKTGNIHCATASSPSAMPQLPRGGRTNFSGQISGPTPASWAGSLRDATSPECPAHPDNARECILPASTSAKAGLAATPARTSGEQTAYVFPRKALPAGAKRRNRPPGLRPAPPPKATRVPATSTPVSKKNTPAATSWTTTPTTA